MKGEPLTIEEIEAANLSPNDGRVPHVPFGFESARWEQFKAQMQPGDLIYAFESAPETWSALAGRAGYVLVREGKPIAQIVTLMN
jgi:hypothetical protein